MIVDTDHDKCNTFIDYFTSVFTKENEFNENNIPFKPCNSIMSDFLIERNDVYKNLKNLTIDKSPGMDDINPRILKENSEELSDVLCKLYNLSVNKGALPHDWKASIVIALQKKGSKSNINNYRPVFLTSEVCKVLESILVDKIMEYFKSNNLLSNNQFGFIKDRSVNIQLINLWDKWTKH